MSGRAQIRRADLKAHILQSNAAGVARVKAIRGHGPEHEILARNLRQVAPRGVFGGSSAAEGEMNIVERDIFESGIADAVQRDAGMAFAGT